MMSIRRPLALLVLAVLWRATSATAETPPPSKWMELSLPATARNSFTQPLPGTIEIASENSASFLYRTVDSGERNGRTLVWRWRVNRAPAPTDLTMNGMDDRPLAVHVWFGDQAGADWSPGRFLKSAAARLLGFPPGRLITYVWSGTQRRGDTFANPYASDGAVVVLRGGDTGFGEWHDERVDLAADYRRLFGQDMQPPTHIAVSADTDDKGGTSLGAVAGLMFKHGRQTGSLP